MFWLVFGLLMMTQSEGGSMGRILAIGDSITAHPRSYAHALKALMPDTSIAASGYPGQGARFIRQHLAPLLRAHRPDTLIVLAGVNDLASGRSFAHITEHLAGMYQEARSAGVRTIVAITVLPWAGYQGGRRFNRARWVQLNDWIRMQPGLVVVDADSMGDDQARLWPGSSSDGIHPNETGHAMLARLIHQRLRANGPTLVG
jgi:lysophospholipase L1-like esterase